MGSTASAAPASEKPCIVKKTVGIAMIYFGARGLLRR
jgi:hypothetical protein